MCASQKVRTLLSFLSKIMLVIWIVKTRLSICCILGKQTKEYMPIVYAIDLRRLTSVQRNPLRVHEPFGNYALNLKYGLALKWNHENLHSTKFPWNGSISSIEDAQTTVWNDLWKIISGIFKKFFWSKSNPHYSFLCNYLLFCQICEGNCGFYCIINFWGYLQKFVEIVIILWKCSWRKYSNPLRLSQDLFWCNIRRGPSVLDMKVSTVYRLNSNTLPTLKLWFIWFLPGWRG